MTSVQETQQRLEADANRRVASERAAGEAERSQLTAEYREQLDVRAMCVWLCSWLWHRAGYFWPLHALSLCVCVCVRVCVCVCVCVCVRACTHAWRVYYLCFAF